MKTIVRWIALGIVVLLTVRCSIMDEPLKVGIDQGENSQIIKIAKNLGYLGDSFEIVEFTSRGDNAEAFYLGRLDITYSSIFDSVYFHNRGARGMIFLVTAHDSKKRALLLERSRREIQGIRVAMEADTDEYIEFIEFVHSLGLKSNDLDIQFYTEEEAADAFREGEVDGLYLYQPFEEDLFDRGYIFPGSESIEVLKEVLVASEGVVKGRRRALKKLVEAWYSVLYIKLNEPEKYRSLLAEAGYEGERHKSSGYYFLSDNERLLRGKEITNYLAEEASRAEVVVEPEELYTGEVVK